MSFESLFRGDRREEPEILDRHHHCVKHQFGLVFRGGNDRHLLVSWCAKLLLGFGTRASKF